MRVFVFEFVTGGACTDPAMLTSLMAEGDMMLAAVVRDLVAVADVEVVVCRDARLDLPPLPINVHWVDGDWWAAWRHCVASSHMVLPIAPETDGILERLSRDVIQAGKILLNSQPDAVALTASKQTTIDCLAAEGLPVTPSCLGSQYLTDDECVPDEGPLVIKPDQGLGCHETHVLPSAADARRFLLDRSDPADWMVQSYLPGQAASLSLMVNKACVCLLGTNKQCVVQIDEGFKLLGCEINGLKYSYKKLLEISERIFHAIPGLWGYLGVDLVITDNGPVLLEVNPRITTSYVGLSQSLGINVAGMLIESVLDPRPFDTSRFQGDCVHVDLEVPCVA